MMVDGYIILGPQHQQIQTTIPFQRSHVMVITPQEQDCYFFILSAFKEPAWDEARQLPFG